MNQEEMDILRFMRGRIPRIYSSKAALARLRRGIGKEIGIMPDLLGFVLPEYEISSYLHQEGQIEKAIYTSLTLYAFHQQGMERCMSDGLTEEDAAVSHRNSFGYAAGKLYQASANKAGVQRRFNQVLTAKGLTELSVHARGIVGLMKQHNIRMDYPQFALDLYRFQQLDWHRTIILDWGKDYYMKDAKSRKGENK